MKRDAQAVAQAQEKITEALENQKTPEGTERGDTSNALDRMLSGSEVAKELAGQQERVEKLMEQMKAVSEQAEGAEPILSRKLYEAVRGAQTSGLEESLEEARLRSRYGDRAGTQEAERKAATAVENLAKNIETAAETVLGSEAEALRMARNELDRLIEDVEKEVAGGEGTEGAANASNQAGPNEEKSPTESAEGKPGEGEKPGEGDGQEAGKEAQMAQAPGDGKGQGKEPGEGEAKAAEPGQEQGQTPGQGKGAMAQAGQAGAEAEGEGKGKGNEKGAKGAGKGEGKGSESAQAGQSKSGKGGASGQGQGSQQRGEARGTAPSGPRGLAGDPRGQNQGGNSRSGGGTAGGWFFDEAAEAPREGPFSGEGYRQWSERLSMVEELLGDAELANEAAKVADDARALKLEHSRNNQAPQAATLQSRITLPLLELRDRVLEELARKGAENPNVPIDRDPVPPAFRDLVRRYYTELGDGQ